MITYDAEQMTNGACDMLRAWMSESQSEKLLKIVRSKAQKHAAEAIKDAVEASPDNLKLEAANANLRRAARYADFLTVWEEIAGQKEPFEIAKLT